MAAPLTDEDVGKPVVDAAGKELGLVSSVEGDSASVDPNPSVLEHVLARLGWGSADDEDYTITEDMLDRVDERVVLRGEL